MSKNTTNLIVIFLLAFVFFASVFSMMGDSATMDEVAHLPAGYSYLTQKDMRLNPEHPPLIKDLAALPLLFIKGIKFPSQIKEWKEDVNGQWGFGFYFLYAMGNPVDKMIFWARIPMILILVLLGFFIFKWAKELFGEKVALLALFLFSFSPTFLAHGRFVTTDIGAATGVLIATYYFIAFLKSSTKKNLILSGASLAFAILVKFNTFLLLPFFGILIVVKSLIESQNLKSFLKTLFARLLSFVLILVICFALVWIVYAYHTANYPIERQVRDIKFLLSSHPIRFIGPLLSQLARISILRPIVQYLLGLFLVFQRASFGHTTFFLGEVSASGWKNYFPVVYAIKETLPFHILTIIALLWASIKIKEPFWQNSFGRFKKWVGLHFTEFAFLLFLGIYWAASIASPLNIGVRHLLPVLPLTILLVSRQIVELLEKSHLKPKCALLGLLLAWQVLEVISIYPHFLAYFNELVGGPNNGYIYVVDSNLDWGQDLKRLEGWVKANGIEKIYVDYFGGGSAEYYLKQKFMPWWGTRSEKEFEKPNYFAISASILQGGTGTPVAGFNQSFSYYSWLNKYNPVAKIGYSIFVYYIK